MVVTKNDVKRAREVLNREAEQFPRITYLVSDTADEVLDALLDDNEERALEIIQNTRISLWNLVLRKTINSISESMRDVPLLETYSNEIRNQRNRIEGRFREVLTRLQQNDTSVLDECSVLYNQMDELIQRAESERHSSAKTTARNIFWKGITVAFAIIIATFWFTGPNIIVVITVIGTWLLLLPTGYYGIRKYPSISTTTLGTALLFILPLIVIISFAILIFTGLLVTDSPAFLSVTMALISVLLGLISMATKIRKDT